MDSPKEYNDDQYDKILESLRTIFNEDEVVELRTIGTDEWNTVRSGYYSDFEKLSSRAVKLNSKTDRDLASNCFVTLNPVKEELISRADNKIKTKPKNTTTDDEIKLIRWLPIDLDPVRLKGIPSTEDERAEAFSTSSDIIDFLRGNGFSDPILASSGNGCHLLYKIEDGFNVRETVERNKKIIHALADRFSNNKVDVDRAVWNPSRIWKLYGTTAIKGENTKERPHRTSEIVTVPGDLTITSEEVLEEFVIKFGKSEETQKELDIEVEFVIKEVVRKYERLNNLFDGDIGEFKSRSEAELSLCSLLIAITHDRDLTYKLMECSKIGKWGQESYNNITFEKALEFSNKDSVKNNKKIQKFRQIFLDSKEAVSIEEIKKISEDIKDLRLDVEFGEDHFITKVVNWMGHITDSYKEYEILAALWVLSAVTEKRLVLKTNQENIYPNIWVTILGQSTVSRKTTILTKAQDIYQEVTGKEMYNNDYSLEGYLELLEREPMSSFIRDEVAGLMAKYHKKYNDGIFELECAIFDNKNYKKTLSGGKSGNPHEVVVSDQYVTKLYATTGDNFSAKMEIDDFLCGYGYRFLYAFPNYKKPWKGIAMQTAEDLERQAEVIKHLEKIQILLSREGIIEAGISEKALELYNKSIREMELDVDDRNDGRFSSAIGRAEIYIFKIAMLLELGNPDMDPSNFVISANSIDKATYMISNYFLPTMMGLIDRLQEDKKYNMIEKIAFVLRELGGMTTRSKLLRAARMKAKDFDECVTTMEESGEIIHKKEKDTNTTYYILAKSQKEYSLGYTLKDIKDDHNKTRKTQRKFEEKVRSCDKCGKELTERDGSCDICLDCAVELKQVEKSYAQDEPEQISKESTEKDVWG